MAREGVGKLVRKMTLRPYQQKAHDAIIGYVRTSVSPVCIEAATGAGKSHIIAAVAATLHEMTGKRILCLAPSAELVTQNREKYLATGAFASMFSASAGGKETRHPVVFGSPLTVKNNISRFQRDGAQGYAAVIIDECQGLTPTVISIIDAMRNGDPKNRDLPGNPNLRVIGTSATLFRLGDGYIFRRWPDGRVNGDDTSRDPYFADCVYSIGARELIDAGYLTKPVIGAIGAEGYDTSGLTLNSRGQFDAAAVDRAYHGHGRKTAMIVSDVVNQSRGRRGVMFFAATVQHAQEVMASLPPGLSAMVTGETKKLERETIIARFKRQEIKYLVSVSALTTGFDATHVDVVAILRKTESVGLLQQIIGRGLRLHDGKDDCLVLDYTDNLDTHCPDGDLFAPKIRAKKGGEGGVGLTCICPLCQAENTFSANLKYIDYEKDAHGYILDLRGQQVMSEFGPISGHHGRRCFGMVRTGTRGEWDRCSYRWTFKPCPHCEAENDIAARYCCACRGEIIDPNEKLAIDFKAMKKDPTKLQTDEVVNILWHEGVSQRGNKTMKVEIVTPYRQFVVWLQPEARHSRGMAEWDMFFRATGGMEHKPQTVTYKKEDTGFFHIHGYNGQADIDPSAGR